MTFKTLTPDTLDGLKLIKLKSKCKSRGLHITGTKPILIGRILAFQETGSAEIANKESHDELTNRVKHNPSSKVKSKSISTRKLEKVKNLSAFKANCRVQSEEFNDLKDMWGIEGPSIDLVGACLKVEYDLLTLGQFTCNMQSESDTLVSLNLSAHKYVCKEFFKRVSFPELQALAVDNCEFDDETLSDILSACPKLRVLNMAYSYVKGDGFQNMHIKCPDLEWLRISVDENSKEPLHKALSHISKCKYMELDIKSRVLFDDQAIEYLAIMPGRYNIVYNHSIGPRGFELLRNKDKFKLIGCPQEILWDNYSDVMTKFKPETTPTDDTLKSLPSNIKEIDLGEVSFGFEGINQALILISESPCANTLEYLKVPNKKTLDETGLKAIGTFRALKCLDLGKSWHPYPRKTTIFYDTFMETSKNWQELENLNIMESPISIESVEQLVVNCPKLKTIDLCECRGGSEGNFNSYDSALHKSEKLAAIHVIHDQIKKEQFGYSMFGVW